MTQLPVIPVITQLPEAPTPLDTPEDFDAKAFAMLIALKSFIEETNALGSALSALGALIEQFEASARTSAHQADLHKSAAQDAALDAGGSAVAAGQSAQAASASASSSASSSRAASDSAAVAAAHAQAMGQAVAMADTYTTVPTVYKSWMIVVTKPHLRVMTWDFVKNRYVRAPWHQPGKLQYFMRYVPAGHLEVRGDVLLDSADVPDLADYLGVGGKFALDENRGDFLRTLDSGRGVDPGRVNASWQEDEFKMHNHWSGSAARADNYGGYGNAVGAGNTSPAYTSNVGGSETRPRNRAYRLAVQY